MKGFPSTRGLPAFNIITLSVKPEGLVTAALLLSAEARRGALHSESTQDRECITLQAPIDS
jgi:hypothetical protein